MTNKKDDTGKNAYLLKVENLSKLYPIRTGVFKRVSGHVTAVKDASFGIRTGETLGLVGESGCGKSTCGKCICRMERPTAGKVLFRGLDFAALSDSELKAHRSAIQMIFQNPYASLNPRMSVYRILDEPMRINLDLDAVARRERIYQLLDMVGLSSAHARQYPHEFSGGQRQRIAIARAISIGPSLIVADEAVSALDVSIQSQILNLMSALKKRLALSYLFISHDLSVIKHVSDKVAVMYLGRIVESAEKEALFAAPLHPYTRALLSAIPRPGVFDEPGEPGQAQSGRIILKGDVPSPDNPPPGCVFHTRCPEVMPVCSQAAPETVEAADGHTVKCHLYGGLAKGGEAA